MERAPGDLVQAPRHVSPVVFKQARILFNPANDLVQPVTAPSRSAAGQMMRTVGVSTALTCVFNPSMILFNPSASARVPRSARGGASNPGLGFVVP